MNKKNPSLVNNAILNGITQICKILFPIISFSYSAHILGSERIGIFQFSSSIVGYFALLASLGINLYAIREGAVFRDDKKKFETFTSEIFSINVLSMVTSYILLAVLIILWSKLSNYSLFIIINALTIFFTTIGANWINLIYEDYLYITTRFIIVQILSIVLLLFFVKTKEDLLIYTVIKVFSSSMGEMLNFFYIRKYVSLKFTFRNNYKKHLKPVLILFANEIAVTIFVNSDITLLGVLRNDQEVGIYSTAAQLYNIVKRLVYSFVTVALPRFSYLISNRKQNEAQKLYKRIGNLLFLIAMPACVGMIASGKQLLYVLAGNEFISGYGSLCILCPAIVVVSFSNLFCLCALIPNKKETVVLYASITSALVNLVLNFILIPLLGMEAAAITTLIAEIIEVIVFYFNSRNYFTLNINIQNLLSVGVGCIIIFIVCKIVNLTNLSEIVRLIIEIAVSTLMYGIIILLTKNEYAFALISHAKHRIQKEASNKKENL